MNKYLLNKIKFLLGTIVTIILFLIFFIKYITLKKWIYIVLSFFSLAFGSFALTRYHKFLKRRLNKEKILKIINSILSKYFENIKFNYKCNKKHLEFNEIVDKKDKFVKENYITCNYYSYNMGILDTTIKELTTIVLSHDISLVEVFNGTWFIIEGTKKYDDLKIYTKNILCKKIIKNGILHKEWFSKQRIDYEKYVDDEYFTNYFNFYENSKDLCVSLDKNLIYNINKLHQTINKKGIVFCKEKNKLFIGLDLGESLFNRDDKFIEQVIQIIIKIINCL